jgi:hypothetical protein
MGRYSKAIVAVLTAGLIAAQQALTLTEQQRGWVTIGLALLGALGVYAVENKPASAE